MKHAPGGVFLMPQLDDIRKLDGVIFLRRGLYRDGVFRFQMTLPHNYNGWNSHPRIVFTPPIFSPLIDPEVDLSLLIRKHTFVSPSKCHLTISKYHLIRVVC